MDDLSPAHVEDGLGSRRVGHRWEIGVSSFVLCVCFCRVGSLKRKKGIVNVSGVFVLFRFSLPLQFTQWLRQET